MSDPTRYFEDPRLNTELRQIRRDIDNLSVMARTSQEPTTFLPQDLATLSALAARVRFGTGSPVGSVNAEAGTLYLNLSGGTGTTLYVNETGGTSGWVAK